jgi:acyl carrier protein
MSIEQKTLLCVANALNLDIKNLRLDSSNKDFDNWDSFGQIAIISGLEQEFSIQFTLEDIYISTTVEILITKVKKYTSLA